MHATEGARTNRLARESSPYLLLHATNPVDWYPWGEEAFEKARREDKPLFLSVGYSTCYWCHVMERECFSNPEIAQQLNEGFVSIKLDREERPDLDEIYMTATQLLTRSGGWPNSVFLTHDLKPFFAGTYFPPQDVPGRPGFPRVLAAIREAWEQRRPDIVAQGEAVAEAVRQQLEASTQASHMLPGAEAADAAQGLLARRFDPTWGGFGGAPKFPSPSNLELLLDRARRGDAEARRMLVTTLDGMARGGIHDQIGGGFHRYSTDAEWLVPHFEKMLYDNAALAALYAEAAPLAPEAGFERVARMTLDFVLAELTGPEGAFLSAIDAETDAHEGAYYSWTRDELRAVLDNDHYALLASVYGFEGRPQFEGRYVLHLPQPLPERARLLGIAVDELLARIEPGRAALLAARWKRKRPLVDDKVLADWNGLMIAGMARAGAALGEARYVQAAARAAGFVLERLRDGGSGPLLHTYRGGSAKVPALLDDYAFLVHGLLALHATEGGGRWLAEAQRLEQEQAQRLWDEPAGGYFMSGADPGLLVRAKPGHDGAVASGNGIAALNLVAFARTTGEEAYATRARRLIAAFSSGIAEWPLAHVTLLQALERLGRPPASPLAREAEDVVEVALASGPTIAGWAPFTLDLRMRDGWHLTASATEVSAVVGGVRGLRYPEPEVFRGEFSEEELRVYTGRLRIEGEVEVAEGRQTALRLAYQACDNDRCLAPVTREIPLA
jgi:uncharacterized protein YyaL (SSP411 family)